MNEARTMKNAHAVALGRKGGKAGTGASKARTHEQAQKAAAARWAKVKAAQKKQPGKTSEKIA